MFFLYFLAKLFSGLLRRVSHSIRRVLSIQGKRPLRDGGHETKELPQEPTGKESVAVTSSKTSGPVIYNPPLKEILSQGSTSIIARVKPGVVLKLPRYSWWHSKIAETHDFVRDIKRSFDIEEQIFGILGEHPRIIRFLGTSENPRGLLFAEASNGNLQAYINRHNDTINLSLRLKWCFQTAEAIHYIHQKDVIHSDLRPENYLLHTNSTSELDIVLCDFGGSTCGDLDGGHLPDSGFFNPCKPWESTVATDIFSLGSIFYTIMTGHWPYKSPGPFSSVEEMRAYGDMVDKHFSSGKYPSVDHLIGGAVIQGCWTEQYPEVGTLIQHQHLFFKE